MAWPRRSFRRSARYYAKRALRLSASPHAIALGVAVGVFASFLPYVGLHIVIAIVIAWLMRANLVASAIGTAIGNPLTFPLIWAATLGLGRFILYGSQPEEVAPLNLGSMLTNLDLQVIWKPLLLPMTVGGFVLGSIAALIIYLVALYATAAVSERRRRRLAQNARVQASPSAAQT